VRQRGPIAAVLRTQAKGAAMAKLPKFTLDYDKKIQRWSLEKDRTSEVVKTFKTKDAATKGGVLEKVLGEGGGSVKIKKLDQTYQEERTFPRKADPRKSEG
jgi:hypothetical protein